MPAYLEPTTKPCRLCGKPIPAIGKHTACSRCERTRPRIRRSRRGGPAAVKPKNPLPINPNFAKAWDWLCANGPVKKSDLVRRLNGNAKNYETTLASLENCGFLLSEDDAGLIYAFERVRA